MTDTQTPEGARSLLERWRYSGSMVSAQLAQLEADTDAFLALPSVSPDLPADAPGEGPLRALLTTREQPVGFTPGLVLVQHSFAGVDVKLHEKGGDCAICAALNALTSAPAPSSEALREAVIRWHKAYEWGEHDNSYAAVAEYDSACDDLHELAAAIAAEEARNG